MSVQELEKQVQALAPEELARFGRWFQDYLGQLVGAIEEQDDWRDNLTAEQKDEMLRRVEYAKAHPEALEIWEGTTDRIRQRLHALRAQEATPS